MPNSRKRRLQRQRRRTEKKIKRAPKGSRRRKRYKFTLKGILESIRDLNERIRRRRSIGHGAWGGSKSVINQIVVPIFRKHGIPITSRKRWATYGNPSSDHYRGNTRAYAVDGGTANNHAVANEIARAFGRSEVVDYQSFVVEYGGRRFAVQIIYSTHGTGPHLHVGVHRV